MNITNPLPQAYQTQPALCSNPVFIIGAHRSGTTALAGALSKHSQFWASDESFIMFDLFGNGRVDTVFQRWVARPCSSWLRTERVDRDEFLGSIGLGFNALFSSRSQGKRWIDHTPHHALMADVLARMFPGAFFLHILRDGRQVVNSMINVSRTLTDRDKDRMQKGHFLPRWATDFREACMAWRQYTEAAMDFCAKHPERCLTVIHGQLERDPAVGFARILAFLKAAHEDAPASYFSSHRFNSSFGVRTSSGIAPGRRQDPWDVWATEQKHIFVEEVGDALVRYGFATADELALSEHDQVVFRIRQIAAAELPFSATVAVVSKNDPALLDLGGRQVRYFSQDETGQYAGGNPADSAEAITQLETLRSSSVEYLVIPKTAFWWLEYYESFRDHLNSRYCTVSRSDECVIYNLQPVGEATAPEGTSIQVPDSHGDTPFFDNFCRFYETGNTSAGARLNAQYDCLIRDHIKYIKDQTVLDVGSHDGRWSFAALAAGAKSVIGIEPRRSLVEESTRTFHEYGIERERFEFHASDALEFLRQNRLQVDTVFLFGVFYHVHYHVALLQQLWHTAAQTIVVDTDVSPDQPMAGRYQNSISLITERIDNISNAASEIFPNAGVAIVGHPSRRAINLLLQAFQFEVSEVSWGPYVNKWGNSGLDDYASGRRTTFLAVKASAPLRQRTVSENGISNGSEAFDTRALQAKSSVR